MRSADWTLDGARITCKICRVTSHGKSDCWKRPGDRQKTDRQTERQTDRKKKRQGEKKTMDHFSTVLQRPPHFDEDGSKGAASEDRGPRGGLRDILNPVSSTSQAPSAPSSHGTPGTPGAPAPPRPHSSFSLRSPTQSDYHHPSAYSASPPSSAAAGSQPSGARSILNNPFVSASTPSLPPPLQAPQSIASPTASSGLQAPPAYYPPEMRDRESVRENSVPSSFYDPTAESKRERRISSETGSWHGSTPKVSKQQAADPN